MLVVEGQQMVGGILTLWNPQVMNLLAFEATRYTLSVNMQIIGNTKVILCTNVYGPQMLEEKRRMLLDLEKLKSHAKNLHWILAGDFNNITTLVKKKGCARRLDRDAKEFSSFIDTVEMVDIKTSNGQFTWNNKLINQHQIATRLEKLLVSESIILQGLTLDCNILPLGGSNHWLVQLEENFQTTPKTNLLDSRNFGLSIPPSRRKSANGGRSHNLNKGQGCSNYIRNSGTSNINSRSGTRKYLEI
jgi:hypothetical protein